MNAERLGRLVQTLRVRQRLTQAALASRAGIGRRAGAQMTRRGHHVVIRTPAAQMSKRARKRTAAEREPIGHVSHCDLGAVPLGGARETPHDAGMALRKTLEMLKRGQEINDALYRLTTGERRGLPHAPASAPMPADRHRLLTCRLTARPAVLAPYSA